MRLALLAGLMACVAPVPGFAATLIWDKVESGMLRADVEALYPKKDGVNYKGVESIEIKDVVITEKCKAEANIYFEEGKVSGVTLKGNGSLGGRCADTVLTGLSAKYGQPMVSSERNGGILARKGQVYVWNRGDGLTMRYKAYNDGMFGGSSLTQHSWELKYSTLSEKLAL